MYTTTDKSATRVAPQTIENAVTALLKWKEAKSSTEKAQLLPEDEFFYLYLVLKKIPPRDSRTSPYKFPLPHPLIQDSEICLIIDDRPNSNLTSKDAKKKVQSENIPVTKVLKFSKLKTDYKPFEAKRKLCDSYDIFFADKRILTLLPKLLGKAFFKKKKLPLPINLTNKNWKEQVERGCSSGLLCIKSGTCSVVKIGRISMEKDEVVENVVEGIKGMIGFVPKMWEGVRSLHLKLSDSTALPLYQVVPDVKLKIEGVRKVVEVVESVEKENVSKEEPKEGGKKDGDSAKKKKKGRIHEVKYMDVSSVGEDGSGMDVDKDENESEKIKDDSDLVGKKRKKGGVAKEVAQEGVAELGKKPKTVGKVEKVDATKEKKGAAKLGKKPKKVGEVENVGATKKNESEDLASKEVETKLKKKKGDAKKELTASDKNVEKPAKKLKKKGAEEDQEKASLPVKSTEESAGNKGKKKSALRKNSEKKVKVSKQ